MDYPLELTQRLREQKVIPFVGAGASMAVRKVGTSEQLFPSWKQLLESAAVRLGHQLKHDDANLVSAMLKINPPKYLEAAQHAQQSLGAILYDVLKEQIDKPYSEADDNSLNLARAIWGFGNFIITTNYDRVLQWASSQPNNFRYLDNDANVEQVRFMQNKSPDPTVWHLHGRIDNAANLILTPDGYNRLYPENGNTKPHYEAALKILQSLLIQQTFLFIGFSLDDEHFGMQLRGINEIFAGATGPHYALIRERNLEQFKTLKLQNVEPIPFTDFGDPLLQCVRELAALTQRIEPAPVATTEAETFKSTIDFDAIIPADFSPEKTVFYVPFAQKGDQVLGRDQAMIEVHQQLQASRRTSIGQTALFLGLGGLGKTQLAIEYAYAHRDQYPNGIIWISADQEIDSQLIRIADEAKWIAPQSEHKDKLAIALHRLRSHSDCLIIFDNVETLDAIKSYLPLPTAKPHILITSRTEQSGFIPIKIDPLDAIVSLQLLIQEAGKAPVGNDETNAANKIVEALGGLPLALELAGAYLQNRDVSWQEYWNLLDKNLKAALPPRFAQASFTQHEADLYSTLRISQEVFQDEPNLKWVLDLLTWSGAAPMSKELICIALDVQDETELIGALGLGAKLRLLQKSSDGQRYALHRLVRRVRREEIPIENYSEWAQGICRRLGDWFQNLREDFTSLPKFEAELDHIKEWAKNAEKFSYLEASRLTWLQAYPPYHQGNYKEISHIIEKALNLYEKSVEKNQGLLAYLYDDFGYSFSSLGQHQKTLEYAEKALAIRLQTYGEEHPTTAISYKSMCISYNELGLYQKALDYVEKALAIYHNHKAYGEAHLTTADSYNGTGICYSYIGQDQKALEYKEKALAIRLNAYGEEHPTTAVSFDSVGSSYNKLGQYQKALEYKEKALAIRLNAYGEEHPTTAVSFDNVGASYSNLGHYQKALEYAEKALKIRQSRLGNFHPITVLRNV